MKKTLFTVVTIGAAMASLAAPSLPPSILQGVDSWSCRPRHPAVVNSAVAEASSNVISLRGEWDFVLTRTFTEGRRNSHDVPFFLTTGAWNNPMKIRVPGCWEAQLPPNPGMGLSWEFKYDHSPKPIRNPAIGEGWYRRFVEIPRDWTGKRVWIKVGGVKSCAWVWVNRQQAALVQNYCGTYKYDVTDCVKPGERAEILVEVSNFVPSRKGLMSSAHRWGGIYRDIELEATPIDYIDEAWMRGDFDGATAEAHVEFVGVKKGDVARLTIEGKSAEVPAVEGETIVRLPIKGFRQWSPEHPNLYTGTVSLVRNGQAVHSRRERFGFRKIEVRGKEFYLNNRPFFMRGFGDDHVYPITGITPADRQTHLAHLKTARAAGFNFVRLHTHCELPEYFDAADEAGILVEAELPYINGDISVEHFPFDPVGDTMELYLNYRRHPSFAVYSGGNEGSFGKVLDRELYKLVKKIDPDRLKICQDTQMQRFNTAENSDYTGGPVTEWPRGAVNPDRPFLCHEYLNLCVKLDSRAESDYNGAWMPPTSRAQRQQWLAGFGLDLEWGDLLQDSQHALQAFWLKHGVECARNDPYCDGFCLWTIVDVVVAQGSAYTSQGVFDPFWRPKKRGWTPEGFLKFNTPCCILLDTQYDSRVYSVGDRLACAFRLSDYDESADGKPAVLNWRLTAEGKDLCTGKFDIAARNPGPAHEVGRTEMTIPPVSRPVKALLKASIGNSANEWEFWLFPKREKIRLAGVAATTTLAAKLNALYDGIVANGKLDGAKVLIAERGNALIGDALAKGLTVVQIGEMKRSPQRGGGGSWTMGIEPPKNPSPQYYGTDDICLGWWSMGHQVGTAIRDHKVLGKLPHERILSPLIFRIFGQGRRLPQPGVDSKSIVIGGEGGDACFVYLNVRGNLIEVDGLDLLSGFPEGTAILDGILSK